MALTASTFLLAGCLDHSSGGGHDFLKAYREKMEVVSVRGGYKVGSYYATSDYLACRSLSWKAERVQGEVDSLKSKFGSAYYFCVSISPSQDQASDPSGHDILNSEIVKGQSSFAARLNELQNGMGSHCYLLLPNGDKVFPTTYYYDRNWGVGDGANFLFAFPKTVNGNPISLFSSRIVIAEFGLSLGNICQPILKPKGSKFTI